MHALCSEVEIVLVKIFVEGVKVLQALTGVNLAEVY